MDTAERTNAAHSAPIVEKLYMENTLLRVSGALFCHDSKRASSRTEEIVLNRGVAEKAITVRPDPRLGQPGPLAHKLFIALIKKHSEYGRPVRGEVSFTKRELMRLIGRKTWGGADSEQLTHALNEIHYAFVRTSFKEGDGRLVEHSFNIFPEVYLERAERESDPIERCVVTLARPIVASLQDDHFTCLNHTLMRELGTIGQALYVRLFFHFANLFDGHHKGRLTFQKRYGDICIEWLGGLKVLPYRSMIEREQLGSHLRQLVSVGFLASYSISEAANADGFIMRFRPGAAFFADYDRFYRHRGQAEVEVSFHGDTTEIAEPIKLAYLFMEKQSGVPLKAIPYVSSKEVETAQQILGQVTSSEAAGFLDYALGEARKTNFDVKSLGGLRQYLPGFVERRGRRAASEKASTRRREAEREEAERRAYERFWRSTADSLFESLSADEQTIIESLARAKAHYGGRSDGPLTETIAAVERARITADRHSSRMPSVAVWRAQPPTGE